MIDTAKQIEREEINKQVKKFLRGGGRIKRDPQHQRHRAKWIRTRPFRMDLD